jgi:hypothetical protein
MRHKPELHHERPTAKAHGYVPGIASTHNRRPDIDTSSGAETNRVTLRWKSREWQDRPVPMADAEAYVPVGRVTVKRPATDIHNARKAAWLARNAA